MYFFSFDFPPSFSLLLQRARGFADVRPCAQRGVRVFLVGWSMRGPSCPGLGSGESASGARGSQCLAVWSARDMSWDFCAWNQLLPFKQKELQFRNLRSVSERC